MNVKNATRLASLLGTWTGQTHLKTDIGSYELSASFVIHLMPDPTRGYGCALPDCNEVKNQVCLIEDVPDQETFGENVCENIAGNIVDWSDGEFAGILTVYCPLYSKDIELFVSFISIFLYGGKQSLPFSTLAQELMLDFHLISIAEKILEAGWAPLILFWHKTSLLTNLS